MAASGKGRPPTASWDAFQAEVASRLSGPAGPCLRCGRPRLQPRYPKTGGLAFRCMACGADHPAVPEPAQTP